MSTSYSSLDWVLSHRADFTVHSFICVYLHVFCTRACMCGRYRCVWWNNKPRSTSNRLCAAAAIDKLYPCSTFTSRRPCLRPQQLLCYLAMVWWSPMRNKEVERENCMQHNTDGQIYGQSIIVLFTYIHNRPILLVIRYSFNGTTPEKQNI